MSKKYLIGTSGWNYKHWQNVFYPEGTRQKDWFDYYTTKFDTVEVNFSFYRWPKEETIIKWKNKEPRDFIFTLKIPRKITHEKRLKEIQKLVKDFNKLFDCLKRKKGALLFQLPPSFRYNEKNFTRIKELIKILDKKKINVIEFREKNWWNIEVYDLFKKNNITFCSVFGQGMPDDIIVTSKIIYARFHGLNYSSNYSKKDIKEIAKRIQEEEFNKVFAYFNNDINAYAPFNALELKKELTSNK